MTSGPVGVVVIGRNEGTRLVRCLESLAGSASQTVYVDSGSTDGSVQAARALGADVVALDMSVPFTAARARNDGLKRLLELATPRFVQFVDGDCELAPDWIETGSAFLNANPGVAAVSGHLRERHPEASVYNRLMAREWAAPVGEAKAVGGNMMARVEALTALGGFNPALIAGEEPELCVRLRQAGWRVWRLDAEMALHDAAMTRFGQWWRRSKRAGYAYAEGAAMHGRPPERHNVAEARRAIVWGFVLPLVAIVGFFVTPWALLILGLYPVQIVRLARREGWERATFLTLGKLPEAQGALSYLRRHLSGGSARLIEYK